MSDYEQPINPNQRTVDAAPVAPTIDMSKIANIDAIKSKGDDTIDRAKQNIGQAPNVIKNFKRKGRGSGKFNFVQPEKILLPSGGKLYRGVTEDPDVLNGFIYMYPMTVKEEEILSTSRFLKSGAATRMVIDNCIASDIEAKDILLFDSNYLLFYLRSISYGDDYKFKLKCSNQSCEQEFDHTVEISKLTFEELPDDVEEPIKVVLPKTKYTVYTVLPRLFHSEEIYQRNLKRKKSTSDSDTRLVDNLLATIVRITTPDGEELKPGDWEEFLTAIPGQDRAELKEKTDYSTGVDKLDGVVCPYCTTDYSGSIPIGVDFFRF
jgi:hypothetical protein